MAKDKYELYKDKSAEFCFRLKANNGENIGASDSYKARVSGENGIESVKKNAFEPSRFDLFEDNGGKWRFNLKAATIKPF